MRGHRIELGEVEWALRLHPAVREAVVVMVGEHSRRRLVAHVVSSGERVDAELLRQHVASLLPQVMVPAQATWHDQLPLSANGKIDRKALTAWAPEEPSPEPAAEAVPMDGLESAIAAIWAEILGVPVVGRSDLFFDLGGNSMTAVLVTGELSDQLGADVPPRIMFDLASLADVASALRADPGLGPLASAMVARLESAPA